MRFVENIISGIIDHSKTLLYMFFVCIENAQVKKVIVGALPLNWKLLPGISRRDQALLERGHSQALLSFQSEDGSWGHWESLGVTGSHWERGCAALGMVCGLRCGQCKEDFTVLLSLPSELSSWVCLNARGSGSVHKGTVDVVRELYRSLFRA